MKQEMEVAGPASSSTTGSAASRQGMAGQLSKVFALEVHSFSILSDFTSERISECKKRTSPTTTTALNQDLAYIANKTVFLVKICVS